MKRRVFLTLAAGFCLNMVFGSGFLVAAETQDKRKPDLADTAAGVYFGDVISDSQGPSQSGVTLSVTRIGKNLVQITSDYPRLPVLEIPLTKAMNTIVQSKGDSPFVLELGKFPNALSISFHNEVSWSGIRRE